MRSPYSYPSQLEAKQYVKQIEQIENKGLRILMKTILLCGFRVSEILNSYIYQDIEGNYIIRAIAGKTKKFHLVRGNFHYGRFLGRRVLLDALKSKTVPFKSVRLLNLFNVDVEEVYDCANDNFEAPERFLAEITGIKHYMTAFRLLKQSVDEVKIKYRENKLDEAIITYYKPSFHFYRKLFGAELYRQSKNDVYKTVDYMKWKDLNIVIHYIKDY